MATESNQHPLMGPWGSSPKPHRSWGLSLSLFKGRQVGSAAPPFTPVVILWGPLLGPCPFPPQPHLT